jgi:general secretion pathway protein G
MAELSVRRSKEQELRASLREMRTAIDAYKRAVDEGRVSIGVNESGYPRTLEVLVEGVRDAKSPGGARIYFLRRIPRDPFAGSEDAGSGAWGKRSYASTHEEPHEGVDVFDVYSMAPGVGLNGIAYREW